MRAAEGSNARHRNQPPISLSALWSGSTKCARNSSPLTPAPLSHREYGKPPDRCAAYPRRNEVARADRGVRQKQPRSEPARCRNLGSEVGAVKRLQCPPFRISQRPASATWRTVAGTDQSIWALAGPCPEVGQAHLSDREPAQGSKGQRLQPPRIAALAGHRCSDSLLKMTFLRAESSDSRWSPATTCCSTGTCRSADGLLGARHRAS
jgi:hypothetical protein